MIANFAGSDGWGDCGGLCLDGELRAGCLTQNEEMCETVGVVAAGFSVAFQSAGNLLGRIGATLGRPFSCSIALVALDADWIRRQVLFSCLFIKHHETIQSGPP